MEASLKEQALARRGFELLEAWDVIPGTGPDGSIDKEALLIWVTTARDATAAKNRSNIGDEMIGKMLSAAPADKDGVWPHSAVRDVIEAIGSTTLERGIEIGVYNRRGTVAREYLEGGTQEQQLALRYEAYASNLSTRWPRTAAMLRRIATAYRQDARREDADADLRENLDL